MPQPSTLVEVDDVKSPAGADMLLDTPSHDGQIVMDGRGAGNTTSDSGDGDNAGPHVNKASERQATPTKLALEATSASVDTDGRSFPPTEDLIMLPSPVAATTTTSFDVFAAESDRMYDGVTGHIYTNEDALNAESAIENGEQSVDTDEIEKRLPVPTQEDEYLDEWEKDEGDVVADRKLSDEENRAVMKHVDATAASHVDTTEDVDTKYRNDAVATEDIDAEAQDDAMTTEGAVVEAHDDVRQEEEEAVGDDTELQATDMLAAERSDITTDDPEVTNIHASNDLSEESVTEESDNVAKESSDAPISQVNYSPDTSENRNVTEDSTASDAVSDTVSESHNSFAPSINTQKPDLAVQNLSDSQSGIQRTANASTLPLPRAESPNLVSLPPPAPTTQSAFGKEKATKSTKANGLMNGRLGNAKKPDLHGSTTMEKGSSESSQRTIATSKSKLQRPTPTDKLSSEPASHSRPRTDVASKLTARNAVKVMSGDSTKTQKTPSGASTASTKSAAATPPTANNQIKMTLCAEGDVSAPPAPISPTTTAEEPKSVSKRLSTVEIEAASNRLYADAKESKKRKEERRAELEETFPFAPQVNKIKRQNSSGEKDRFLMLHEKAKEALRKREERQRELQRAECTFKPAITAKSRRLSKKNDTTKPRYENLYYKAQELKQKREEKMMEKEKQTVEQCSFKPNIKTIKSPIKPRPLYDIERQKQRKLELEQKKIDTEMNECTFKPKVGLKKTKSKGEDNAGKPAEGAFYDRLYQGSLQRKERLERLRQEYEEQERATAPFQPKITSTSTADPGKASKKPFHQRLYSKDYMQKLAAQREQQKLEEEQKFTFKPHITPVPEEVKTKNNNGSSPEKDIFKRLYEEKDRIKEKIGLSEEIRLQKEMEGCTFHPQIESDVSSNSSQSNTPIWERLLSYDKNQAIEERKKIKEQLEMQECTFKPDIKSDTFTPTKRGSVNIFERLTASTGTSPEMRRNSERKTLSASDKRYSVPSLKGSSIGDIVKSSSSAFTPESKSSNPMQPRSLPKRVNATTGSKDRSTLHKSKSFSVPKRYYRPDGSGEDNEDAKAAILDSSVEPNDNVARTLVDEFSEVDSKHRQTKSVLENYDSWAANLEEKMRNL